MTNSDRFSFGAGLTLAGAFIFVLAGGAFISGEFWLGGGVSIIASIFAYFGIVLLCGESSE